MREGVMTFEFKPATRMQRKARIALDGPSGSGKTFTALLTATTLADKVAVIDTERASATLYSGVGGFRFDHLDLTTHEPETLIAALAAAGSQGYEAVVIDSLSHFWMGVGGMLEQADAAATRNRGPFGGWKEVRPLERRMIEAILAYPGHVIVTMRTKTDWVIEKDEKGKEKPRRIGLKAEQREGIEYEFDVVGDMDLDHNLIISKSRCSLLADSVISRPDEKFGATLRDWLNDGTPALTVAQVLDMATAPNVTVEELRALHTQAKGGRLLGAAVLDGEGNDTTLGDLLVARGKALASPPVDAPAAAQTAKQALWEYARSVRSWSASQLDAEFSKWAGKPMDASTPDERLQAFLIDLRTENAA
jgi:hypothetical protein